MYLEECKDYHEILLECFSADEELVNVHHIAAGKGIEGCVESTLKNLSTYEGLDFHFYNLCNEDGSLAGFVGVEHTKEHGPHLITFFIMPSHRNKYFIETFWEMVVELIGPEFYSGLFEKNIKAHKFFERAGAKEIIRQNDTVIYKFDMLCH